MRTFILFSIICYCVLQESCHYPEVDNSNTLISYVNPFIGTDGKGKTYPGATVPHGMVQLSPDNGRGGWDWISGYFYPDTVISGFSHLHLSGTGAGDLYDLSFLPTSGLLTKGKLNGENEKETVYSTFSHQDEKASPGYYQVYLKDYDINVELTATKRTGLQRYQFNGNNQQVRFHLGYTRNWDQITESFMEVVNDSTIVGYRKSTGWARDQNVYFKSVFSAPFKHNMYSNGEIIQNDSLSGKDLLAILFFNAKEVMVKTGISSVSIENASENLAEEQSGFDFDAIRNTAENIWEEELNRITIEASENKKKQFYTAMYHSMLAPTLYSDINGEYKGADGEIWTAENQPRYSTYSLWDTYRAWHPLLTIKNPDLARDMVNSMLDFYDENKLLPVWNLWGGETNMMMGYHSVSVISDLILKGEKGIDLEKAYTAMKASANQERPDLNAYKKIGYVPYEQGDWNVSLTLEYAFDDWCIAQVAKKLGNEDEYAYYLERSSNYKNHFDSLSGFFRPKSINQSFKKQFEPLSYHPADFCEANAWQYLWYAPQDILGLIDLMGGQKSFEKKLDLMFETEQKEGEQPEWISGFIGQYVHGNEPSHHVPYLYQFVNKPSKTQEIVRRVMDELYNITPDGLAGNEDCGQMSAWYIFSALGFYPVNPTAGEYVLGSPIVDRASIQLKYDKKFDIVVKNQASENLYVKFVTLNGKRLTDFSINHQDIMQGGELVFEMSDKPQNTFETK